MPDPFGQTCARFWLGDVPEAAPFPCLLAIVPRGPPARGMAPWMLVSS